MSLHLDQESRLPGGVRAPHGFSGRDAGVAVGAVFAFVEGLQLAVEGMTRLMELMERKRLGTQIQDIVEQPDESERLRARVAELELELELREKAAGA